MTFLLLLLWEQGRGGTVLPGWGVERIPLETITKTGALLLGNTGTTTTQNCAKYVFGKNSKAVKKNSTDGVIAFGISDTLCTVYSVYCIHCIPHTVYNMHYCILLNVNPEYCILYSPASHPNKGPHVALLSLPSPHNPVCFSQPISNVILQTAPRTCIRRSLDLRP